MAPKQKGSSTTTNETSYPDWVTEAQKNYITQVGKYVNDNSSGLPMAGMNDTQRFAKDIATGLNTYGTSGRDAITTAGSPGILAQGYTSPAGTAAQLGANDYQQFMNPFQNEVIDRTAQRLGNEKNVALTMADARAANGTAFGGSGAALERAQISRQHEQTLGEMEANLRAQGFDRANALASQNVDRQQQMGMSNLAMQDAAARYGADSTNNMAQFNAGQRLNAAIAGNSANDAAFQRELAKYDAAMRAGTIEQASQQAQMDRLRQLIDWYGGKLPGVGSTSTTTQPIYGNPLESILGLVFPRSK